MWWWWNGYWPAMALMPLIMLGLMVACMVLMMRMMGNHSHRPRDEAAEDTLEILKRRFARGEISKEEYDEKRRLVAQL
jgi:putative membrane protein